jgi:hypothetical protein
VLPATPPPIFQPALTVAQAVAAPLTIFLPAIQRQLAAGLPPCAFFLDGQLGQGLPLKDLKTTRLFTMFLSGAGAEDALLAAGAALAYGVPSCYVVFDRKELPWFTREAEQTYPGLVTVLEGDRVVALQAFGPTRILPLHPRKLRSEPVLTKVDTFVGCEMSGLTEEQYADGRHQLQLINTALAATGRWQNFCEGINVSSASAFGTPHASLGVDLEEVRRARSCVFYAYDDVSRRSGMWVELGAALAWKKPCTLLVPGLAGLPPVLRGKLLPPTLKIATYTTHEALIKQLRDPNGVYELRL